MAAVRVEMGVRKWVGNSAAVDDPIINIDPHFSLRIYEGAPSAFQLNYYGEGLTDGLGWFETGYADGLLPTDEFLLRIQFDRANTRVSVEVWDYYGNRHAQKVLNGVAAPTWAPGEITVHNTPAGSSSELDFVRVYNTAIALGAAAPTRVLSGTPIHAWEFEGNLTDTGSDPAINMAWQGGGSPTYGVEPFAPTVAPNLGSLGYFVTPSIQLGFTDTNSGSQEETHIDVERRVGGAGDWRAIGWALADELTYTDNLVRYTTTYQYRVRARNRFGYSDYSNVLSITTLAGADTNPTITENAKAGTAAWNLSSPATAREIEGYADQTSVNRGGTINLKVNSLAAENFNLEVFRVGWYGGLGARRVRNVLAVAGTAQTIAAETGVAPNQIREMAWTTSYALALTDADPTEWPSGIYLARLTQVTAGKQAYIVFCVRDDTRQSRYLYNQPVNTYQAYNAWPATSAVFSGRGLYGFNSQGAQVTKTISFNRPYAIPPRADGSYGIGAGELLAVNSVPTNPAHQARTASPEINFLRWIEKEGYDVQYCTDTDLHTAGESLWRRCYTLLFPGHQEYWSYTMRNNVRNARDYGRHLAFLGANAGYWNVEIVPASVAGTANRAIFAVKDVGGGSPGTRNSIRFRDLPTAHPDGYEAEYNLVGVQYQGDPVLEGTVTIELAGSDPIMAGTGLTTGSTLAGLVGYEWDNETVDGATARASRRRIAHSIVNGDPTKTCDMVIWEAAPTAGPAVHAGATVFAAGTLAFPWALDDYGVGSGRPTSFLNTGAQQLMRNVLAAQAEAVVASAGQPLQPPSGNGWIHNRHRRQRQIS